MFYLLEDNESKRIDIESLKEDKISIGYVTLDELVQYKDVLGVTDAIIQECISDKTHFRTSIEVYDELSFGIVNIINVMDVNGERDRIAFIIKKKQFILVEIEDSDGSSKEMFESSVKRFKQNPTLEKVIFGILDRMLLFGNQSLEKTENRLIVMEQKLVKGNMERQMNRYIFELRRELSTLRNFYEQLVDIGEELQENENDLFDEKDLRYFGIFISKASRLSNSTQVLSENLVHLRESIDAALNYSINKTMKVFTIVTTIFLPLTLIVGWYGMNFKYMPELSWKYGYPMVIVISILVVLGCIWSFKRRKLL